MSVLSSNYSPAPCLNCQGTSFEVSWVDDPMLGRVCHLTCIDCGSDRPELTPAQVAILEKEDAKAEAYRQEQLADYQRACLRESSPELFRPFRVLRVSGGAESTLTMCSTHEEASRFIAGYIEAGWLHPGDAWRITQNCEHYDDDAKAVVTDFTGSRTRVVAEGVVG